MIGGARGLPERGKRATGASRFYRVTATPGPLFVKWRDSLEVPADLRTLDGSAPPDNSSRSPRAARKVGPLVAPRMRGHVSCCDSRTHERIPRQSDTGPLGRTRPTISGGKGDRS